MRLVIRDFEGPVGYVRGESVPLSCLSLRPLLLLSPILSLSLTLILILFFFLNKHRFCYRCGAGVRRQTGCPPAQDVTS